MKLMKLGIRNICTLCLILFFIGCATTTPLLHVPPIPLTGDFGAKKVDLNVELHLSDDFTNYVIITNRKQYTVGNYHHSIGDSLNSAAIEMAEKTFENIQISQGGSSEASSNADAVLVPTILLTKFIFDKKSYPGKLVFVITVKWNLYAPDNKKLLYTTDITGNGEKSSPTISAQKKKLTEALHKTINDLMVKSYQELNNSWEIRKYAIIPSIILAAPENRVIIAQKLIDNEKNNSRRNKLGLTTLYHAIDIDDKDLAAEVLKMGIDPNGYNSYKVGHPIHVAALEGKIDFVDLMLENGADINAKDQDGWTLLFYYTLSNYKEELIRHLLRKGAEVHPVEDTADNSHTTAMSYLVSAQYNEGLGNNKKIIEDFTGAVKYFKKASLQYKELYKETSKKKMSADFKNFLRVLGTGLARAGLNTAAKMQAQQQATTDRQIKALRIAESKGISYNRALRSIPAYKPTNVKGPKVADPILLDTTNLKILKKTFAELSDNSHRSSVEMTRTLECYKNYGSKEEIEKCKGEVSVSN